MQNLNCLHPLHYSVSLQCGQERVCTAMDGWHRQHQAWMRAQMSGQRHRKWCRPAQPWTMMQGRMKIWPKAQEKCRQGCTAVDGWGRQATHSVDEGLAWGRRGHGHGMLCMGMRGHSQLWPMG